MTRLAVSAALLLTTLTAHTAQAQDVPTDVQSAADDAGVDPVALLGAVYTTHLDPRAYLVAVGELAPPTPVCGWPICGPLGVRLFCIEGIESHHGTAMWNPTPVWDGEHAGGWLGFLPSTARSVGVSIGNRASEWAGAARMLATGRGREFYGVSVGIC